MTSGDDGFNVGLLEQSLRAAVADALWKCGSHVESLDRRTWTGVLQNGRPVRFSVRLELDSGWVTFDAGVEEADKPVDPWSLLAWNACAVGCGRLVLLPRTQALRLRAEVPLDEQVDVGRRVRETCDGLRQLWGALHGAGAEAPQIDPAPEVCAMRSSAIAAACSEAGWQAHERPGSRLAVDLDVPGRFHQAIVEGAGNGGARIAADLARWPAPPPSGIRREALSMLLLSASSDVRLARAMVATEAGATTAGFEVRFESVPLPAELDDALAALSVACLLCGEEVRALEHDRVAERYLAVRGKWLTAGRTRVDETVET